MKHFLTILCLFLLVTCLTACDPVTYYLQEQELAKDLTSIELVNYENENQTHFTTWVPDQTDDLRPFDSTKATVLQVLEQDQQEPFLKSLSGYQILDRYYAYDSPKGVCIRLTYSDGSFMIIWANYFTGGFAGYIGTYSADGQVLDFIGSFSDFAYYQTLVTDYFGYELPQPE